MRAVTLFNKKLNYDCKLFLFSDLLLLVKKNSNSVIYSMFLVQEGGKQNILLTSNYLDCNKGELLLLLQDEDVRTLRLAVKMAQKAVLLVLKKKILETKDAELTK